MEIRLDCVLRWFYQ